MKFDYIKYPAPVKLFSTTDVSGVMRVRIMAHGRLVRTKTSPNAPPPATSRASTAKVIDTCFESILLTRIYLSRATKETRPISGSSEVKIGLNRCRYEENSRPANINMFESFEMCFREKKEKEMH